MNKIFFIAILLVLFPVSAHADNNQIKQAIIKESIASYPGNCPCPYNTDRAGRSCGRRSAYSKPGGYSPVCYPDDVTEEMIREYLSKKSK